MTKQYACQMWKKYLKALKSPPGQGIIENPAVMFTEDAKNGVYDSLSADEYDIELQNVEQEADLFEKKVNASSIQLFIVRIRK